MNQAQIHIFIYLDHFENMLYPSVIVPHESQILCYNIILIKSFNKHTSSSSH